MRFIDTHCHLNLRESYPDLEDVLTRAREAGVDRMIVVGIDREFTPEALRLVSSVEGVYAVVGVHPNSAAGFGPGHMAEVEGWLRAPGVVGIGETGLDFYRDHASPADQMAAFRRHAEMSRETGLPLVIHCRDAYDELLDELERQGGPYRGVMHCFGGTLAQAERALALGFHLGVDGPVTYGKSDELRRVIARCPADRLLLETDCPFLAPVPYRGKRNEPAYIPLIAEAVAAARGETPEQLAAATTANAERLFGL